MNPRELDSPRNVLALCAALSSLSAACTEGFDPASEVQGIRVLAVRMQGTADQPENAPASGVPGDTVHFEMLFADGSAPPDAPDPRPLQIAWLGGCHNPPTRLFYGCAPFLQEVASAVEAGGGEPIPGYFGLGPSFDLPLPEGIVSSAPRVSTDPVHFGVSYVYFAVCAGELVPRPGRTEGVPLDCVDSASGAVLGSKDFVVGFSTLYSYENVINYNPAIESLTFDGIPVTGETCVDDLENCVPRVPACPPDSGCPTHHIGPRATAAGFETMPDGAYEIQWANFFATSGEISKEQQLVSDRETGAVDDYSSGWRAPEDPGRVRLWVTLNDERGGAVWAAFDVIVE